MSLQWALVLAILGLDLLSGAVPVVLRDQAPLLVRSAPPLQVVVQQTCRLEGGASLLALTPIEKDQLKSEAVERLRAVAIMDFTVLPDSFEIAVNNDEVNVMFKVRLANGDLVSVSALFKRDGRQWRFVRVGTLCCGEH